MIRRALRRHAADSPVAWLVRGFCLGIAAVGLVQLGDDARGWWPALTACAFVFAASFVVELD